MGKKNKQKTVFTWHVNVNNEIFQRIENLKKAKLFQHYIIQSLINIIEKQSDLTNINMFKILETVKISPEDNKKVVFRIEMDKTKHNNLIEFLDKLNYNQKRVLFMIVLHYIITSKSDHLLLVNTDLTEKKEHQNKNDKFNLTEIFSK